MRSKMFLSANRPRVERHGQSLVVTLTDVTGSTLEAEMNMSEGYCMANAIMEIISDYGKEKNGHDSS